ncbi:MAG: glycosyltransferase family 2 protein [Leptolyngbyaceae bacterium]|nr:glycosyltransferase family 2 protein [Leptolyngbyaceae bacterium]
MTHASALSSHGFFGNPLPSHSSTPVRSISVVIITQDEEVRTADAIRSCLGFADELIVVDGGSRDRTVANAQALGCQVYINPWPGYAEQRNFGIAKATHEWIFLLDSDEVVSEELAAAFVGWKHAPKVHADVFAVKRVNNFLGIWLEGQAEYMTRLYRKSLFRIKDVLVHEGPDVGKAKVIKLSGILWHHSFRNLDDQIRRFHKYTDLEAQQAYQRGKPFSLIRLVLKPPARFLQRYVLQRLFRQGVPGFAYSILWTYYDFLREIKLYEMYSQPTQGSRERKESCRNT